MAFDPSHLDTSFGALIRSGAALLGIVLGSFVLAATPRTRFTRLFGLLLVIDGIGYSVFSLAGGYSGFPHKELVVPFHLVFVPIAFIAAGLLLAAFWPDIRQLPMHRVRFASALVAAVPAAALTPIAFLVVGPPPLEEYGSKVGLALGMADSIAYSLYIAALAVVGAALLASVRRDGDEPRSRALLLMGGSAVANTAIQAGNYIEEAASDLYPVFVVVILLAASAAMVQLPFAFLGLRSVGGWSRWVPIVLLLACFATAPIEAWTELNVDGDTGFGGIVSLAGLLGIGYAIFRLDLLGVVVPRPRAGLLAAFGLAALFITAQVAQSFFTEGKALLLGSGVAVVVGFGAMPLQRMVEHSGRRVPHTAVAKYRRLVETAWTDGKLGANEKLLLAESRRQLGLDAEAAATIDDEVARQHLTRGRAQ